MARASGHFLNSIRTENYAVSLCKHNCAWMAQVQGWCFRINDRRDQHERGEMIQCDERQKKGRLG